MGFLHRVIRAKDASAIPSQDQIAALKLRRDWQARSSQFNLARNTKFGMMLSAIMAPSFAVQFLGSAELGLALLVGSVLGYTGTSLIGVYARRKRWAIEESYKASQGESIRLAVTEEQLHRFFPESRMLTVDSSPDRM